MQVIPDPLSSFALCIFSSEWATKAISCWLLRQMLRASSHAAEVHQRHSCMYWSRQEAHAHIPNKINSRHLNSKALKISRQLHDHVQHCTTSHTSHTSHAMVEACRMKACQKESKWLQGNGPDRQLPDSTSCHQNLLSSIRMHALLLPLPLQAR